MSNLHNPSLRLHKTRSNLINTPKYAPGQGQTCTNRRNSRTRQCHTCTTRRKRRTRQGKTCTTRRKSRTRQCQTCATRRKSRTRQGKTSPTRRNISPKQGSAILADGNLHPNQRQFPQLEVKLLFFNNFQKNPKKPAWEKQKPSRCPPLFSDGSTTGPMQKRIYSCLWPYMAAARRPSCPDLAIPKADPWWRGAPLHSPR